MNLVGDGRKIKVKRSLCNAEGSLTKVSNIKGDDHLKKGGGSDSFLHYGLFQFNFNVCILSIKKKNIRDLQPFPQFKQRESKGTVKIAEWGRTLRSESIFGNWKPFKSDEMSFILPYKLFLFSFTFWSCRKTIWLER